MPKGRLNFLFVVPFGQFLPHTLSMHIMLDRYKKVLEHLLTL